MFLSAPACDQLLWAWASGLCLCGVGWWVGLVWLFFPLFVGVVWSLRRPSAVCFLGVVVLASAAAAALHQCAVYLGAVHFTKLSQTEVVIGVFCNTAIENAGADKELASIKQVYTKSNQVPGVQMSMEIHQEFKAFSSFREKTYLFLISRFGDVISLFFWGGGFNTSTPLVKVLISSVGMSLYPKYLRTFVHSLRFFACGMSYLRGIGVKHM